MTLWRACSLAAALIALATATVARGAEMDWILGCWSAEDGSAREAWVRQSESELIGFGVALKQGRVAFYEMLSIELEGDGARLTAHPQGQAATVFRAGTLGSQEVSFTNPVHDYPEVISYRLDGDWLRATTSQMDGSQALVFDKLRCEALESVN